MRLSSMIMFSTGVEKLFSRRSISHPWIGHRHWSCLTRSWKHEQKVTGLIHKVNDLAIKENDYATQVMLQWFITEQAEKKKNATQIVDQLKVSKPAKVAFSCLTTGYQAW